MIDKDTKVLIAKRYIEGFAEDDKHYAVVQEALQKIFVDVSCIGAISPLATAFSDLVDELLGEVNLGWVEWWLYEADLGTRGFEFAVDGTTYLANEVTVEEFLNIVIV